MRRKNRVKELASEANIDIVEAYVILWDSGFNYLDEKHDIINASDLQAAKKLLGVPTKSDLTSYYYWSNKLNISENELRHLLIKNNFSVNKQQSKLPKGAVVFLKKLARQKNLALTKSFQKQGKESRSKCYTNTFTWHILGHEKDISLFRTVRLKSESQL